MPIERSSFIKNFAQQALDSRTSLFLGAGGSCDAGYPTWAALFEPMAKELGVKIDELTDYYKLAQYYSNEFGKAELKKRINSSINSNNFESPLINELLNIGFTNIWTTNFDNVIEENYKKRKILTNKIYQDADLSNIDLNRQINIFKMNGDISNPEGMIATTSEYEKYRDLHRLMLLFFKRELISSTFLFVGYSFTDNLVLDCLSEITKYLGDSTTYHYTIIKKDSSKSYFRHFIDDLERRYYIRVLLVDDYSEIPKVLSDINKKIRSKKVFISGAFNSYEKEIGEYSHELSQKLSSALFDKDYRIVNGIGRRFGTHLIGYANEYLAKHGVKNIERHLIIKPFVGNKENSIEEKNQSRANVISQCGSAIFVFGDKSFITGPQKSGVMEEFEIAHKQHKIIIPITYNGMVSEQIWSIVKSTITEFPYLEGKIDYLTADQPVDNLVKIIIHILDSIQDTL